MLTALQRIDRQKSSPALVRLHRALSRLRSTVTLMHTGAHPDDEQSGLMAYFRFALGIRVIIACSTRGEGGQNALGRERGGALGVIRSREMEEAARILDCDIHWLGHGPDDTVHDFGFSKDGDGTFAHWGEEKTVERLVRAYRTERPDIVLPTFLDVPGQHGHHRAMTRAAEKALQLAADENAFPEHFAEGLTPWQVAKFYLPAWSGGGDTYDDELPPPDTTLRIRASSRDEVTGADYDRIGEWSRACHATQGMGRWPDVPKSEWPLHLKSPVSHTEETIFASLPQSLAALAAADGVPEDIRQMLLDAHIAIEDAIAAYPTRAAIIERLVSAAKSLSAALSGSPDDFLQRHGHRLRRKLRELDAALIEAALLFERAGLDTPILTSRSETSLVVEYGAGASDIAVMAEVVLPEGCAALSESRKSSREEFRVSVSQQARLSPLFAPAWRALGGNGQGFIRLKARFGEHDAETLVDLDEPLIVAPATSVRLDPSALVVSTHQPEMAEWRVELAVDGITNQITIRPENGWLAAVQESAVTLRPPEDFRPGLTRLLPTIDGAPAWQATAINHRHVGTALWREQAALQILALDLRLPDARIGYVGGGADNTSLWLMRMGFDVTELEERHLAGDLSQFSTIVVGIFAFGLRSDLTAATDKLHRFVEQGGHLVTLYHRPSDGWHADHTPPRKLAIGSPSLRWRVTNPNAPVTVLIPGHPLLTGPNVIGEDDWNGWHKERGLYFASSWNDAYQPLLSMHDDGEQPLFGGLVSAEIGRGRHTHTSLVLHHQLDRLVPGAFRLFANLVQPAR